jgi:hypothetical protein
MKTLATAFMFLLFLSIVCNLSIAIADQDKWTGVDESVVQKIAKEHGRETHTPLIDTDQGDLLLFVFLIAGTIGGFTAGYYWRVLMVEKAPKVNREKN